MRRASIIFILNIVVWTVCSGQSLTVFRSSWGVLETSRALERTIQSKPIRKLSTTETFNLKDDSGAAVDSLIVIAFEDPQLTEELLACEPTAALDLPQKIIVWSENGDVYIGFMDAYFMKRRFLIRDCEETIQAMTRLSLRIINETIRNSY